MSWKNGRCVYIASLDCTPGKEVWVSASLTISTTTKLSRADDDESTERSSSIRLGANRE